MKHKRKSRGSEGMRKSLGELQSYINCGMTLDDIVAHYRKHHPDRICTASKVSVSEPGEHTAASIKQMRLKLEISQATFAELLGVSTVLVQGWEQGVREPSPLARRLLDIVRKNPGNWLASLTPAGSSPKSRRAG